MKLAIDFYSKDELALQLEFSGRYPFPETEASELFLLACYTLRQLNNLGQHLVAKALAGWLVSNTLLTNLSAGSFKLPEGRSLLYRFKFHASSTVAKTKGLEESVITSFVIEDQLRYNESTMQVLDNEFLAKVPRLVNYSGRGKKGFDVSLPPFALHTRGFGILGGGVNYYALHSTIGLFRFLGQKHIDNKAYLDHMNQVAELCGSAYIFQQIPADQVALANDILKRVGVS